MGIDGTSLAKGGRGLIGQEVEAIGMFDLITGTVDRPFRDKHPGATVLSVAAHILILGGVIGAAVFVMTEGLPKIPTMIAFVAEMPAPPPPPPPPPAPAPPQPAERVRSVPTTGDFTVPIEVPTGIVAESGISTGVDQGVPGGVEGGIPGGVVGGIVGGIFTDVAPPPPPPLVPLVPQKLAPVRVGGDVKAPELVYRVEPIYPDIAVLANVTGIVILEATIDERGQVVNVVVLRSKKLLDQAAVDAVKQWQYTPLLLNGAPRAFILTVTLNFSIK